MTQSVIHPFEPIWDQNSRILILGSFPSVRSRETGFYYGHPQNRFWPLLARLYGAETPNGIEERTRFVLARGIALWDTVESCTITGSSDASIRNARPNDIPRLLSQSGIRRIYCNGRQAYHMYQQYCEAACGISATPLPSTSAANAAWRMAQLTEAWRVILE